MNCRTSSHGYRYCPHLGPNCVVLPWSLCHPNNSVRSFWAALMALGKDERPGAGGQQVVASVACGAQSNSSIIKVHNGIATITPVMESIKALVASW
jgi:hypothetical protein